MHPVASEPDAAGMVGRKAAKINMKIILVKAVLAGLPVLVAALGHTFSCLAAAVAAAWVLVAVAAIEMIRSVC